MEQQRKFNTGDIVQLRSGGPKMAVAHYVHQPERGQTADEMLAELRGTSPHIPLVPTWRLRCQWFDGGNLHEGEFPEGSLEASPG